MQCVLDEITYVSVEWGSVGINYIHCHLLLEESKGQGVQRLACQTLVS